MSVHLNTNQPSPSQGESSVLPEPTRQSTKCCFFHFIAAISEKLKTIFQIFCKALSAGFTCVENFVTRCVSGPKKMTLCYRPFQKDSPEVLKIRELLKAVLDPSILIEEAVVNENDPNTQKITGARLLMFDINHIGRLDDIGNMKTVFDKSRPGKAGVVIVSPAQGYSIEPIINWFKKDGAQFVTTLDNLEVAK